MLLDPCGFLAYMCCRMHEVQLLSTRCDLKVHQLSLQKDASVATPDMQDLGLDCMPQGTFSYSSAGVRLWYTTVGFRPASDIADMNVERAPSTVFRLSCTCNGPHLLDVRGAAFLRHCASSTLQQALF